MNNSNTWILLLLLVIGVLVLVAAVKGNLSYVLYELFGSGPVYQKGTDTPQAEKQGGQTTGTSGGPNWNTGKGSA